MEVGVVSAWRKRILLAQFHSPLGVQTTRKGCRHLVEQIVSGASLVWSLSFSLSMSSRDDYVGLITFITVLFLDHPRCPSKSKTRIPHTTAYIYLIPVWNGLVFRFSCHLSSSVSLQWNHHLVPLPPLCSWTRDQTGSSSPSPVRSPFLSSHSITLTLLVLSSCSAMTLLGSWVLLPSSTMRGTFSHLADALIRSKPDREKHCSWDRKSVV